MWGNLRIVLVVIVAVILVIRALAGAAEKKSEVIPPSKVDRPKMENALKAANELLRKWNEAKYDPVSEDFSAQMKKAFTPAVQKQTHEPLIKPLGEFVAMQFYEAVQVKGETDVYYRFRAYYARTDAYPEVRVVVDGKGKIDGFWIKPWEKEIR